LALPDIERDDAAQLHERVAGGTDPGGPAKKE